MNSLELSWTVMSCHELLGNCRELSETVRNCWKLSETVGTCQKLLGNVRDCRELSGTMGNCHKLLLSLGDWIIFSLVNIYFRALEKMHFEVSQEGLEGLVWLYFCNISKTWRKYFQYNHFCEYCKFLLACFQSKFRNLEKHEINFTRNHNWQWFFDRG